MNAVSRKAADSVVETIHIVRPTHLNAAGRLFGGILMQWIDEVAALAAKRHCRCNVTTVSVDNLVFLRGAYQNDAVVIRAKVTYVGRTSIEVKVDTFVENIQCDRTVINQAFITMVALDENGKPTVVPRLELETDEERDDWEKGEIRKEFRIQIREDLM